MTKDRFLSYIKTGEECSIWPFGKTSDGYGAVYIDGEHFLVHRLAYLLTVGFIPKGLSILHKCDNHGCFNPSHLYAGSQKDNIKDLIERGKFACSKLNKEMVRDILISFFIKNESLFSLRRRYNVDRKTIYSTLHGKQYTDTYMEVVSELTTTYGLDRKLFRVY